MTKVEILAEQARLQAAYDAASNAVRSNKTPATMDAVVAAGRALSAFITEHNPPKVSRWRDNSAAARSGRRQHAEMRARYWGR